MVSQNILSDCSCVFLIYRKNFLLFAFSYNQIARIGESQDPVAEGMPLSQLVILAGIVDINQRFIVKGTGSHLVVAGWEKLDQIVPVFLAFSLQISFSCFLKLVHHCLHEGPGPVCHVIAAEIVHSKFLAVDFVHGTAGIGHSRHFVRVILLPPVEGGCDIHGDENLADVFAVIASSLAESFSQIQIIGT